MTLSLSAKITADASGFVAGVAAAQGALGGLDRAAAGSGAAAAAMAAGAQAGAKSARELQIEAHNSAAAMQAASSAAGMMTAAIGALGLVDFVRRVGETSAEFQKLNGMLVTATGSTAAAASAFRLLKSFASETPYDLAQVTEAFIKLKNLGLDASLDSMRAYGNFASAMGKPLMQMIEAAADAATGEFERLKEFGIRAETEGAKIRFTFRGVETEVANSAGAIAGYLTELGKTKFAGEMERQAATLGGAFSNLGDSLKTALDTVGQGGLAAELQAISKGLSEAAAGGESAALKLGAALAAGLGAGRAAAGLLAENLDVVAGAAAGVGAMAASSAVLNGLAALRAAIVAAGGAAAAFNAALLANPIGLAAAAVGVGVAAYVAYRINAGEAAQAQAAVNAAVAESRTALPAAAAAYNDLTAKVAADTLEKKRNAEATLAAAAAEAQTQAIRARVNAETQQAMFPNVRTPGVIDAEREAAAAEGRLSELSVALAAVHGDLAELTGGAAAASAALAPAGDSAAALSKQFRAAAEAAGVVATKQGLVGKATSEAQGHIANLERVLGLGAAGMAELGTSAGDVARIMDNLRQSIDPVAQAVEGMNQQIATLRTADGAERSAVQALQKINQEREKLGKAPLSTVSPEYLALLTKAKELETARVAGAMKSEAIVDLETRIATARRDGNQAAALRLEKEKAVAEMVAKGVDPTTAAAKAQQDYGLALTEVAAAGSDWEKQQNLTILSARRLAEAQLQGADAVREAEIVNRAAAEADKERVALDSARGQAILAKVRAEEKWTAAANDNAALRAANDNLSDLKAEIALMGQSAAVRDRALRSIQIQRQAVQQFGSATSAAAREWIGLQEQIADNQAILKFQDDVNQVAAEISKDVATAMFEGFSGSETDIMDWFRSMLKRMAIEIFSTQFVLPVTTSIVSAVPSLFAVSSPVTGSQAAAAVAGQAGGGLGSTQNLLSLGSKFMPSNWTSGISAAIDNWAYGNLGIGTIASTTSTMATTAAGGLANSLGVMPVAGGVSNAAAAGSTAATAGSLTAGLTSYLGALGVGAGVGGLLGPLLANGNRALGGVAGAASGAAAGALAGTFLFPGVGTLAGALLGGAGGGLGGLLGTRKPEYPAAQGGVYFDGGRLIGSEATTDNNGDPAAAAALRDAMAAFGDGLMAVGRQINAFGLNIEEKNGQYEPNIPGDQKLGSADAAMIALARYQVAQGNLAFDDPNVARAAAASKAQTAEKFLADLNIAKNYDATLARLQAGLTATAPALEGMRAAAEELGAAAAEQVVAWRDSVVELGLGTADALNPLLRGALRDLAGLGAAADPLVGLAAATKQAELNFEQLKPTMAALGMTAAEQTAFLGEMTAKAAADYNDAVALTQRQGRLALDHVANPSARATAADSLAAAGYNLDIPGVAGLVDAFTLLGRVADAGTASGFAYADAQARLNDLLTAGRLSEDQYLALIQAVAAEMARAVAVADAQRTGLIAVETAINAGYRPAVDAQLAGLHLTATAIDALRDPLAGLETAAGGGAAAAEQLRAAWGVLDGLLTSNAVTADQAGQVVSLLTGAYQRSATAASEAAAAQAAAATAEAARAKASEDLSVRRLRAGGDAAAADELALALAQQREMTEALAAGYGAAYIEALRLTQALEAQEQTTTAAAAAATEAAQAAAALASTQASFAADLLGQAANDLAADFSAAADLARQAASDWTAFGRSFSAANDNLLTDPTYSNLGAEALRDEARRQFDAAAATVAAYRAKALAGTATETDRGDAADAANRLSDLQQRYLSAQNAYGDRAAYDAALAAVLASNTDAAAIAGDIAAAETARAADADQQIQWLQRLTGQGQAATSLLADVKAALALGDPGLGTVADILRQIQTTGLTAAPAGTVGTDAAAANGWFDNFWQRYQASLSLAPEQQAATWDAMVAEKWRVLGSLETQALQALYVRSSQIADTRFDDNVAEVLRTRGVPGFVAGGDYSGGYIHIVGEEGPEVRAGGAARYWSHEQTKDILSPKTVTVDMAPVAAAMDGVSRAIRDGNARIIAELRDVASRVGDVETAVAGLAREMAAGNQRLAKLAARAS